MNVFMKSIFCSLLFLLNFLVVKGQWIEQSAGYPAYCLIKQVIAINDNVAWATPDCSGINNNTCIRTIDGGNEWEIKTINGTSANVEWLCLAAIDSQHAWALLSKNNGNDFEGIFKTIDGGNNWTTLNTSSLFVSISSDPLYIHFWNVNDGIVIGSQIGNHFEIYLTSDGGITWTPVNTDYLPDPLPTEDLYPMMYAIGNGALWFSTSKARAFKTTDMGYSWYAYDTGLSTPNPYQPITAKDENTCWMADKYNLKRTDDGGITWNYVSVSGPMYRFFTYVPTTSETLVSFEGVNNTFPDGTSYSLDGGNSWVGISYDVPHFCVSFANNHTGWTGSENHNQGEDGLYKYGGSFIATGNQINLEKDAKIYISPNPNDGRFNISIFSDNILSGVIYIYDLEGKEVYTKSFKNGLKACSFPFDLSDQPKGIYLFNVITEGEFAALKLLIE